MGILDKKTGLPDKKPSWDVFCSYSRLDNDLFGDWIKQFSSDLKERVQLLLRPPRSPVFSLRLLMPMVRITAFCRSPATFAVVK